MLIYLDSRRPTLGLTTGRLNYTLQDVYSPPHPVDICVPMMTTGCCCCCPTLIGFGFVIPRQIHFLPMVRFIVQKGGLGKNPFHCSKHISINKRGTQTLRPSYWALPLLFVGQHTTALASCLAIPACLVPRFWGFRNIKWIHKIEFL